jgi:hypothetical protein
MKEIKDILRYGVTYTEASSQAYFYHLCMLNNIEIYLEQYIRSDIGKPDSLVVFNNKTIIVEFKYESDAPKKIRKYPYIKTPQFIKYSRLKLPIVIIDKYEYVEIVFNILLNMELKKGIFIYNPETKKLEHDPYPEDSKE